MLEIINKFLTTLSTKVALYSAAVGVLLFSLPVISSAETDISNEFTIEEIKSLINEQKSHPKDIADIIMTQMDVLSSDDLAEFEELLLKSRNLDIAAIGLKLIKSDKQSLKALGLELISDVCITKPQYFQPNTFYAEFSKMGLLTEPYIVNIIRNTGNDFCREWACELYVTMFSKAYANEAIKVRLSAIRKKEIQIYENLKKFFKDPDKVKRLYETKLSLGNILRSEWGKNQRYPLRLLAIIHLLDNLKKSNHDITVKSITKKIDSKHFNFNILSNTFSDEKHSPLIPDKFRLRYLAKSVFINDKTNTFEWLPEKKGGFTIDDLKIATNQNNKQRIDEMERILHQFICALLLNQLKVGDGNREINLLKKFHFGTWDKKLEWDDCILTVNNKSIHSVPLILTKKADIEKILTGQGVSADFAEEKKHEFHIPSNFKFVWFIPAGDYQIDVNVKKSQVVDDSVFKFKSRKFTIDKNNLTLNIH